MVLGKYTKIATVLALSAILILAGCGGYKDPSVYAVVNGEEISREDFQRYVSFMWFDPEIELTEDDRLLALENLISERVYLAEAIRLGYEIEEDAAEKDYEKFRTQVINQMFSGSSSMYYAHLQELKLTESWMIRYFEQILLINKMIDDERDKVEDPDEKAIEDFYKEQRDMFAHGELRGVRHILINDGNFPEADQDEIPAMSKDLVYEIYDRLLAGEDFAKLAKEYSQDGSAQGGGDIGQIEKSDVVKEFGDVAFAAELNEIAEPVESEFGWHILQVTEIKEPGYYEMDDQIRYWIISTLYDKNQKDAVRAFLTKLVEEAEIQNNIK